MIVMRYRASPDLGPFSAALIPIVTLIALGYLLRRLQFLPDVAWAGMERLTYFILFPALLVGTLGQQEIKGVPLLSLLTIVVVVLTSAALLLVGYFYFRRPVSGATFTSIFQGGVRFNAYITLAVAQGLYGVEGLTFGSLLIGMVIVVINLLCISAFVIWGDTELVGATSFLRQVVGNPLIIACAVGWALSLSGAGLPGVSADILEILGRAALPFGLLAVGAALRPDLIRGHSWSIAVSSVVQYGWKPVVAALLCIQFGMTGAMAAVVIIAFMTPTAPSAYILARQLGGDAETMASIITFQTVAAFVVMPLLAMVLL